MVPLDEIRATELRFEARREQRERSKALVAAGRWTEADSPGRVAARLEHLALTGPSASGEVLGLERLIGRSNLSEFNFLARGAARGASVARVVIQSRPDVIDGYGSGVLVSERLLLTNHHVLAGADVAGNSAAEFGYQVDDTGRLPAPTVFALEPQEFYFTDPALDFTLVAVATSSTTGQVPLGRFGWTPLIPTEGKILKGEWLNIIQHPNGEPKAIALRENQLVDVLEEFLHYETDTAPGSSGSPVYNDQWEMVALHHSGVPRRDGSGRVLAIDGSLWSAAMGEEQIAWIANEGVRISRIAERLASISSLTPAQAGLRDAALSSVTGATRTSTRSPLPTGGPAATPVVEGNGELTISVPIRLALRVAVLTEPTATLPAPPASAPSGRPDPDVAEALAELDRSRHRPYYDEVADAAVRDDYYRPVNGDVSFQALSDLVRWTHRHTPRYKPIKELYPWVDLQPNLQLRSLYTGESYPPETFILEDARTAERRLAEAAVREASTNSDAWDEFLEATLPYNCEHVVPQSWFEKREPMRGDLHHLFACESVCNSFRGNIPFFDFEDLEEAIRKGCGRREAGRFEPATGKGPAARATLYFLLRYPRWIDDSDGEYRPDRIPTLLEWHASDPPTLWERHRNQAIFERQGNRNPLIDQPGWAGDVCFTDGLR